MQRTLTVLPRLESRLLGMAILAVALLLSIASESHAVSGRIARQVISTGAVKVFSANRVQYATVGQPIIQTFTSPQGKILSGFWGSPNAALCCLGSTGNVDCDFKGEVNIADLSSLVDYLFVGMGSLCCTSEANMVRDATVDVCDLATLVDYLFVDFHPLASCRN